MTVDIKTIKTHSRLKFIPSALIVACIGGLLTVSIETAFAAPKDDLVVMFRGDTMLPPPGGIAGTVTNKSTNYYKCVDLVFYLKYKSGASGPAEQRVRVKNLLPSRVQSYSSALHARAGFGLKRIESCKLLSNGKQPLPIPPTPPAPYQNRDCTLRGVVNSIANFEGRDDRGQIERVQKVYLFTPAGKKVSEDSLSVKTTRVNDHRAGKKKQYLQRKYSFARIPANLNYVVKLGYEWKTKPVKVNISCPNSKGRFDFRVPPLMHTGNRLGG
ncbi:MAG: hypothetical protein KAG28_07020 [Cocleimonas sp.]|nr:hypothetical protein [Cocleimonas sp.]